MKKKITWKVDADHSEVMFKVKYLMLTSINGAFTDFNLTVETNDEDPRNTLMIDFDCKADALNTNHLQRDLHLKSADYFDTEQYPFIRFKGGRLEQKRVGWQPSAILPHLRNYMLTGALTIKDITREITLNVDYEGKTVDEHNRIKSGFTVHGFISRSDFGMNQVTKTAAGKMILSDEIHINCNIQLTKQQSAEHILSV